MKGKPILVMALIMAGTVAWVAIPPAPAPLIEVQSSHAAPAVKHVSQVQLTGWERMRPLVQAMFGRRPDPNTPGRYEIGVCKGADTLAELPEELRDADLEPLAFTVAQTFHQEAPMALLDRHRNEPNFPEGLLDDPEVASRMRMLLEAKGLKMD